MKKLNLQSVTLIVALALVGCAGRREPQSDILAADVARSKGQEFSLAVVRASASNWATKDVEVLVDLYTDDAILFPPKGDPIRGRDAVKAYWTRTPDQKLLEHSIETERADLSGDLLIEHGRFSLVNQSGENPPERGSANFISVWKRGHDGVWRKYLDSWW